MNETQLKIFINAADCGSLTKAADRLFLSPASCHESGQRPGSRSWC